MKEFFVQALRYALNHDEVIAGKPILVGATRDSEQGSLIVRTQHQISKASAKTIRKRR
jgi:hypothetical protein